MDKFTDLMLERTGLLAMVGKAERGPAAIESIRRHGAAYLMAVGGAAICFQGRTGRPGRGILRSWYGGDLRIRGQGHARHRCG
jgi:fumarate hydratase class I